MKKILIVTGGSGGHVVPALSIFDHLKNDFKTILATDYRGSKFINKSKYQYNLIDLKYSYPDLQGLLAVALCGVMVLLKGMHQYKLRLY